MGEFTFIANDGCPLHAVAVDFDCEGGTANEDLIVVLFHGGGPDHRMFLPLARSLGDSYRVMLPDVRGYGRSVCSKPSCHNWDRYVGDAIALLDHLGVRRAIIGGGGLGTTIALRTALAYRERVHSLVLISVEDIEDDEAKRTEVAFLDAFAERVRVEGIEAAWAPILQDFAPIIGELVREAIPRSDPSSIAAAAAIGRDRSFRSADELAAINVPTLIIPGNDARHPTALAQNLARILPQGRLASVALIADLLTADDLAKAFAPAIREFLRNTRNS